MADSLEVIKEGSASIPQSSVLNTFYNPVQQFNRDLSILVINTFLKLYPSSQPTGNSLLEALSATGLRSIRYWKEIPTLKTLYANDLSKEAVTNIHHNFAFNGIHVEDVSSTDKTRKVFVSNADACLLMYQHSDPLDNFYVIDIDPYGSASPFLDAAMRAIADGGLLCVTCTDMAVLCGGHVESCFAKYNSAGLKKSPFPHESALRILLSYIDSVANKYKMHIIPLLSLSIDFYVRVFVQVKKSAHQVKFSLSKRSSFFLCSGCHSYFEQPLGKVSEIRKSNNGKEHVSVKFSTSTGPTVEQKCPICSFSFQLGGPYWNGPLHCKSFIDALLVQLSNDSGNNFGTVDRIKGMLTVAKEELEIPFYFPLSLVANVLHCNVPPIISFYSALLNAGYDVSGSHCEPAVFKTNAPMEIIWSIAQHWIQTNCPDYSLDKLSVHSPAYKIATNSNLKIKDLVIDFTLHPLANPSSRKHKLVRYQENPTKNWGPKARPKRKIDSDEVENEK